MAIMQISEVTGQTAAGYDQLLALVCEAMQAAPGFIIHSGHATPTGWRVIEMWESREDAARFFAEHIVPLLPIGIRPKLNFEELHGVVAPAA